MEVNFNNLRKQAIYAYEKLVDKLNFSMQNYEIDYNEKNIIKINAKEIENDLNSLKTILGTIALCNIPGDDDIKDVFSEIYPEDSERCMTSLNIKD